MALTAEVLQNNRYNPDFISTLEDNVKAQVSGRTYNLEANLALLKLYQFFPQKVNNAIVTKILAKSIMNLPATDCTLANYLLTDVSLNHEGVRALISLYNLLETSQFKEFWENAKAYRALLDEVPGFDDAVRQFILGVVALTFQSVSKDYLADILQLQGSALDAALTAKGCTLQSDNTVLFPAIDETQTKPKKIAESIQFEQISRLLKL